MKPVSPKNKKNAIKDIAKKFFIGIFCVVLALALGISCLYAIGKWQLKNSAVTASSFRDGGTAQTPENIDKDGKEYAYNKDIYTILCLGIDNENNMVAEGGGMGTGGQADANFLLTIDTKQKRVSIIALPRDTMTEIDIYDFAGKYVKTTEEHLTLQYAYGDGGSDSCALMQKAVSNLMGDLPIHAYAAFNLHAIKNINGALKGVEVVLEEDFEGHRKGEKVLLKNDMAYRYVQWRDCGEDYSADARLSRQKQYLTALAQKVLAESKKDIMTPLEIYRGTSDSILMDISMLEMAYLISEAVGCEFSEQYFYKIPGEQQLAYYYEEYQVDREALEALVAEVFYLPLE